MTQPSQCRPEYTMTVRDCEGGLGRAVCIVVSLPGVRSAKEITLDVAKVGSYLSTCICTVHVCTSRTHQSMIPYLGILHVQVVKMYQNKTNDITQVMHVLSRAE